MSNEPATLSYDLETEPEFSFKKIIQDAFSSIKTALQNWQLILLFVIAGAVLGIAYSFLKSRTYTARLSFVVEDAKSSGGSLASAVAGAVGMDLGSLSGGSGIIGGDNMLELLKSNHFIKKTLLTPYSDSGDNGITLADRYASVYHLKEKWAKSEDIGRDINFYPTRNTASRLEDSLLQVLMLRISDKELSIAKPDKKLNIFEIETTMRDEKLAQLFCERLLQITTDFYIDTKVGRLKRNVDKLQQRADSISQLLNRQTVTATSENSKLIDLNPVYATSFVGAEISTRNKVVLSTIYTEVVKNLEVTKTALIQETPTVQVIDHPELPLKINRMKWYQGIFNGVVLGFLLIMAILLIFKRKKDEEKLSV